MHNLLNIKLSIYGDWVSIFSDFSDFFLRFYCIIPNNLRIPTNRASNQTSVVLRQIRQISLKSLVLYEVYGPYTEYASYNMATVTG